MSNWNQGISAFHLTYLHVWHQLMHTFMAVVLLTGYHCRAASSLKPAPLVINSSAWPSSPGWALVRLTNQRRAGDISRVGGQGGGGGGAEISGVECLLQRILLLGFLSQFSGVHRAEQTPSGQLECSWAGGRVGLMLPPTLMGGWVNGLELSINSASRNH